MTARIYKHAETGEVVESLVPIAQLSTVGELRWPGRESMLLMRELRGLPSLVGYIGPIYISATEVGYVAPSVAHADHH